MHALSLSQLATPQPKILDQPLQVRGCTRRMPSISQGKGIVEVTFVQGESR